MMYTREKLEWMKTAFDIAMGRTCLTADGKEVFRKGYESVLRILSDNYNHDDLENVEEAERLIKDITANDMSWGRERGYIIKKEDIFFGYGSYNQHRGNGGHGGHRGHGGH